MLLTEICRANVVKWKLIKRLSKTSKKNFKMRGEIKIRIPIPDVTLPIWDVCKHSIPLDQDKDVCGYACSCSCNPLTMQHPTRLIPMTMSLNYSELNMAWVILGVIHKMFKCSYSDEWSTHSDFQLRESLCFLLSSSCLHLQCWVLLGWYSVTRSLV